MKYISYKTELLKLETQIRDRISDIIKIYYKVFSIRLEPNPSNLIGTIQLYIILSSDRIMINNYNNLMRINSGIFNVTKSMILMDDEKLDNKLIKLRNVAQEKLEKERIAAQKEESLVRQRVQRHQEIKEGVKRKIKELLTPEELECVKTLDKDVSMW